MRETLMAWGHSRTMPILTMVKN